MEGLFRSTRLTFLLLFAALGLSGCGLQFFTPPKENPVISDNVSNKQGGSRIFRILSNTPERRLAIFNIDKNDKKRFGTYCAEAPAIQSLAPRSQGLMLFRDAGYRYCEAYMNGFINGDELVRKIDGMVKISKSLIEKELAMNNGKIGYVPPAALSTPQQANVSSLRTPGKNAGANTGVN